VSCVVYSVLTFASTVLGCRLAYGSWPWEPRKTWHWTEYRISSLLEDISILDEQVAASNQPRKGEQS
jgi:hypothetical protein